MHLLTQHAVHLVVRHLASHSLVTTSRAPSTSSQRTAPIRLQLLPAISSVCVSQQHRRIAHAFVTTAEGFARPPTATAITEASIWFSWSRTCVESYHENPPLGGATKLADSACTHYAHKPLPHAVIHFLNLAIPMPRPATRWTVRSTVARLCGPLDHRLQTFMKIHVPTAPLPRPLATWCAIRAAQLCARSSPLLMVGVPQAVSSLQRSMPVISRPIRHCNHGPDSFPHRIFRRNTPALVSCYLSPQHTMVLVEIGTDTPRLSLSPAPQALSRDRDGTSEATGTCTRRGTKPRQCSPQNPPQRLWVPFSSLVTLLAKASPPSSLRQLHPLIPPPHSKHARDAVWPEPTVSSLLLRPK